VESEGVSESNDAEESQVAEDSSGGNESSTTKTEKMSAMECMRLNDSAIEYLDESYHTIGRTRPRSSTYSLITVTTRCGHGTSPTQFDLNANDSCVINANDSIEVITQSTAN
jgi:hypothetical protein